MYLVTDGQDIKFLSFEKYCDIENVFYYKVRFKKPKNFTWNEISSGNYLWGKICFRGNIFYFYDFCIMK